MITTDGTRESVHAFAQAVRDALSDLPADEVDELTDGLEADLSERADELGGTDAFGDPVLYADELRASAGLPERPARQPRSSAYERGALALARAVREVRTNPFGAWLVELVVSLRPVWWVIRGWTIYQFVALVLFQTSFGVLPVYRSVSANALQWLLMLVIIVFSVQWGRGRWLPGRWSRALLVVANIGVVLAILPLGAFAVNDSYSPDSSASSVSEVPQQGLYSSGRQVFNIYAYGPDGTPLQNVRLYDQDGHPLLTNPDPSSNPTIDGQDGQGNLFSLERSPLADGNLGWAVYPLQSQPGDTPPETPPFSLVQPLTGSGPTATTAPMAPGAAAAPATRPTTTPTPTPTTRPGS